MPKFLDHHKMTAPMPSQMALEIAKGIKAGAVDPKTSVKGLYSLWSKNEAWCVTDAPNAEAVHKYHEGMGIKLGSGDVTEVSTAL